MTPIMNAVLGAGALALLGTGAAAAQEENSCVYLRNVNGYSVIDDKHVLLNGGANRHYLVSTKTRCSGLRSGIQLGTTFRDTQRICPPFIEYVTTGDGWRCAIDSIEEVESRDAAKTLIEQRESEDNSD